MVRSKAKRSFEDQLHEVENIVQELEHGELDLNQLLKRYAEGVELIAACRQQLEAAEQSLTGDKKTAEEPESSAEKTEAVE